MAKKVKLTLIHRLLYEDEDGIHSVRWLGVSRDDGCFKVVVVEGLAYYKLFGTDIYAPLKDTPEELAKNPDIELVYKILIK